MRVPVWKACLQGWPRRCPTSPYAFSPSLTPARQRPRPAPPGRPRPVRALAPPPPRHRLRPGGLPGPRRTQRIGWTQRIGGIGWIGGFGGSQRSGGRATAGVLPRAGLPGLPGRPRVSVEALGVPAARLPHRAAPPRSQARPPRPRPRRGRASSPALPRPQRTSRFHDSGVSQIALRRIHPGVSRRSEPRFSLPAGTILRAAPRNRCVAPSALHSRRRSAKLPRHVYRKLFVAGGRSPRVENASPFSF